MRLRGILPQVRVGRLFGLHTSANCIGCRSGVLTFFSRFARVFLCCFCLVQFVFSCS